MFPLDSLGLIRGYTGGRKCATNRFWTIAANKPVGGKTTCGAVRRLHQGLCQTVKFVRMTMYPKERGRTAGRACMWCASTVTTINLFIPCNVISTCGMWEHRQKCASLKAVGVMPGARLFVRCWAIAVRTWNHRQLFDMLPNHIPDRSSNE